VLFGGDGGAVARAEGDEAGEGEPPGDAGVVEGTEEPVVGEGLWLTGETVWCAGVSFAGSGEDVSCAGIAFAGEAVTDTGIVFAGPGEAISGDGDVCVAIVPSLE
jgi:hypothetical protein